jgi:hypothetical protein
MVCGHLPVGLKGRVLLQGVVGLMGERVVDGHVRLGVGKRAGAWMDDDPLPRHVLRWC